MKDEEMAHGEIIIVRRGHGGDHDDHHGGVWKIAFADFMTAMMAFFLVMWLINASNEETKKAVASYFNPIKLTDTTTNSKGINNPKYGVDSKDKQTSADVTTIDTPAKVEIKLATQKQKFDEQALFVDPYSILAEIEGGVGQDDGADKKFNSEDPGDGSSMNKGVSFQDPFDPNSWSANQQETADIDGDSLAELDEPQENISTDNGLMNAEENDFTDVDEADLEAAEAKEELKEEEVAALDQGELEQKQAALEGEGKTEDTETGAPLTSEEIKEGGISETELASGEASAGQSDGEVSEKITEAAADIKKQLDAALTKSNLSGLDVEVKATSEGVLVVLSDNNRNGMFTIGSARPTPSLVQTMRKLGGIVSEKDGKVVISGHTDGRKYQSGDYDNWRLSTARAHMAYYMLVRGGLAEERVEKIVGQAAVNLKVPDDPNAAANRRIEVVIKPI